MLVKSNSYSREIECGYDTISEDKLLFSQVPEASKYPKVISDALVDPSDRKATGLAVSRLVLTIGPGNVSRI